MKNLFYIKKLKFHNLFTGAIIYKMHIQVWKLAFRVPYKFSRPQTDEQSKFLGITN